MNATDGITTSPVRYTTVTLDMGYTLVDLNREFDHELIRLAGQAGISITLDDVRQAARRFWIAQAELDANMTWEPSAAADEAFSFAVDRGLCLQLGLDDPELHAVAHVTGRRVFHDPASFTVYPEVFATLDALRSRELRLGIISNWSWRLHELCQVLGLAPYFDFIVSSARVGASKPHPAIFRAALAHAGCDPARILHAGDSLQADVMGAKAVGMTPVLLDRTGKLAAQDGYHIVTRLDQILELLAP